MGMLLFGSYCSDLEAVLSFNQVDKWSSFNHKTRCENMNGLHSMKYDIMDMKQNTAVKNIIIYNKRFLTSYTILNFQIVRSI